MFADKKLAVTSAVESRREFGSGLRAKLERCAGMNPDRERPELGEADVLTRDALNEPVTPELVLVAPDLRRRVLGQQRPAESHSRAAHAGQ